MESATFRKWLTEQGCRFDRHEHQRHEGRVMVTVHREGRKAEVHRRSEEFQSSESVQPDLL